VNYCCHKKYDASSLVFIWKAESLLNPCIVLCWCSENPFGFFIAFLTHPDIQFSLKHILNCSIKTCYFSVFAGTWIRTLNPFNLCQHCRYSHQQSGSNYATHIGLLSAIVPGPVPWLQAGEAQHLALCDGWAGCVIHCTSALHTVSATNIRHLKLFQPGGSIHFLWTVSSILNIQRFTLVLRLRIKIHPLHANDQLMRPVNNRCRLFYQQKTVFSVKELMVCWWTSYWHRWVNVRSCGSGPTVDTVQ